MWNANKLVQDLNSDNRAHFLRHKPLHHDCTSMYVGMYSCIPKCVFVCRCAKIHQRIDGTTFHAIEISFNRAEQLLLTFLIKRSRDFPSLSWPRFTPTQVRLTRFQFYGTEDWRRPILVSNNTALFNKEGKQRRNRKRKKWTRNLSVCWMQTKQSFLAREANL